MKRRLLFHELAALWCEAKRPLVKHSTMCTYGLIVKVRLLPFFGRMGRIEEAAVQRFILERHAHGHARKTIKDTVAVLRAIVKYGAKRGLFPAAEWELDYPRDPSERRLPTLAIGHQRRLMAHLLAAPTPANIGVLLALSTGMRIGEICALTWEDVDLKQGIISVNRTLGRVYNCERHTTERTLSSPKTRSSAREIPIVRPLLLALRRVRRASRAASVVAPSGWPTEPRVYREYFYRLLRALGIPSIVFHGLRHTFATRCVESQCDLKTVSELLGHATVATTLNLYVHPSLTQKRAALERMGRLLAVPVAAGS